MQIFNKRIDVSHFIFISNNFLFQSAIRGTILAHGIHARETPKSNLVPKFHNSRNSKKLKKENEEASAIQS